MNYLDFDLLIERSEEGYTARVLSSPAGQATVSFRLPFSDLELENFLLRVGRPRRGVRRLRSPEMEAVKTFGSRLFETVFSGTVRGCLRSSLDEAHRQGAGLRIRLRLAHAPELADLPWEYLHNPSLNRFLSLSAETPLVRYLDLPERIRPLAVEPPLKVLVMISSPSDYPSLDAEEEWEKLKEALRDLQQRGLVVLERLDVATLSALQKRLRQGECHVFHFIGHGAFDERAQDGVLVLEDAQGRGRLVSGHDLGTLLHDHRPLRLAVLNACEGARTARSDPFAGTAQSLVQQGIPAVIAMQFEVTDEAAITLAREFYGALADGYPVDAALAEARKAVFAQGNDVEWGKPVLYMRSPDGVLFDIQEQALGAYRPPPPSPVEPELPEPGGFYKRLRSLPPLAWAGLLVLLLLLVGVFAVWLSGGGEKPSLVPTATAAVAIVQGTPTETATPSKTPTPTDTPTPTSTPTPCVEVIGETVNIRTEPETVWANVLGQVNKGDQLPVLGRTETGGWWLVDYAGQNAWVAEYLVKPCRESFQVPVVYSPTLKPGDTRIWAKDESAMVYVPAGLFRMGSDDSDPDAAEDEKPHHQVHLGAFWMDRTEVTNAQYERCVEDLACSPPTSFAASTRDSYFANSEFEKYPVIYVDWNRANAYCTWAGKRLPTEAEWEKVARGTDNRMYPWGNAFDGSKLNFCDISCALDWRNVDWDDGHADTAPVGSYPEGRSPYGALDMLGNVWEWVADWYDVSYYVGSPGKNPSGPLSGYRKAIRGGAWDLFQGASRVANRYGGIPSDADDNVGFRCAYSASEP